MPVLLYGSINGSSKQLYAPTRRPIETSMFDSFKIEALAPYNVPRTSTAYGLANHWWFTSRNHTAVAWHTPDLKAEQVVFLPELLDSFITIELLRQRFTDLVPPPLIFRFNNPEGAYGYVE